MMINKKEINRIVLGLTALFLAGTVFAQPAPPPGPCGPMAGPPHHTGPDALDRFMIHPEMIMRHLRELDLSLSNEQKDYIKKQFQEAQTRFTGLQWGLQDEMGKLIELARDESVDERAALKQLEKTLALENEIKKTRLLLAVRVKNKLTAEQQAGLKEIREQKRLRRDARKERMKERKKPARKGRD